MIPEIIRWHGRKKAVGAQFRRSAALLTKVIIAGSILAACSSGGEEGGLATAEFKGSAQNNTGLQLLDGPDNSVFVGAIASDEPRASLAARTVLENGGTAVDAITALYFNLAVTMPHEAGLGGGGICLVHDPEAREVTSYNFLPRRSRAGGPVAVPGNVRGFALMHAVHGTSPWSSLVAPAEVLAAKGHEVSRALASEIGPLAPAIRSLPQLAEVYLGPNGRGLQQGDVLVQKGLAAALGRARASGPSGIYSGEIATAFAQEATRLGSAITLEELRAYRPSTQPAQTFKTGDQTLSIPAADTGAGTYMASIWPAAQSLNGADLMRAAQSELARAGAETNLPGSFGSTGFVVATAGGDAAACAVTMNGPFGTGRMVPGTGIIPARAPDAPGFGLAGAFLAPALVTNDFNGTFFFAGSSAGGPQASASVLEAANALVSTSTTLEAVHRSSVSNAQSLLNVVACPGGAPREGASCVFGADPKGAGLGVLGFPPL